MLTYLLVVIAQAIVPHQAGQSIVLWLIRGWRYDLYYVSRAVVAMVIEEVISPRRLESREYAEARTVDGRSFGF
jgi:hypothetical protein